MSKGSNSDGQLRSIVDRILRIKEEQDDLSEAVREIYAEAKSNGYDKTALGKLVAYLRKVEKQGEKVAEEEAIFETYLASYRETGDPLMRVRSIDYAKAREAAGLNGKDH